MPYLEPGPMKMLSFFLLDLFFCSRMCSHSVVRTHQKHPLHRRLGHWESPMVNRYRGTGDV